MLRGKLLRIFLILSILISIPSYACIPCDKEAGVIVVALAKPNFPKSYRSTKAHGNVTFKADIGHHGKIEKIEIVSLEPDNLPKDVINKMITSSRYRLTSHKKDQMACSVKSYELTFNFDVPEIIKFTIDIDV